jgi:hypothetical protein
VDFGFHDVTFCALDEAHDGVLLGGGNLKVAKVALACNRRLFAASMK